MPFFILGCIVGVSGTLLALILGSVVLYVLMGARSRDNEAPVVATPRLSVVR